MAPSCSVSPLSAFSAFVEKHSYQGELHFAVVKTSAGSGLNLSGATWEMETLHERSVNRLRVLSSDSGLLMAKLLILRINL